MITWLMVGLLLFTESACERGKNGLSSKGGRNGNGSAIAQTDKADEEDIYRLTCYTCVNVSDNKMCNEWAIDTPCPAGGRDFCRSLHILDSRGQSVLVSKSCVSKIECSPASVGCVPIDTQKICISCCDTSYCNVGSPTNATNATFSSKRPKPKGAGRRRKGGEDSGGDAGAEESSAGVSTSGGGPGAVSWAAIGLLLGGARRW